MLESICGWQKLDNRRSSHSERQRLISARLRSVGKSKASGRRRPKTDIRLRVVQEAQHRIDPTRASWGRSMEIAGGENVVTETRPTMVRRFLSNIREQKWMAITIDLVIVVLGVFLGLQAQQWADSQKQSVQQERYMERLSADFTTLKATQESHIAALDNILEGANYVLELVRMPEAEFRNAEVDDERLRRALRSLLGSRVPPGRAATYVEMLSASQLSSVRSAALRDKLAEYDSACEISLEVFHWITTQTQSAQPIMLRHFRSGVVLDDAAPSGFRAEIENYSLTGMRADPEFDAAVSLLRNGAANIRGVRIRENNLTRDILSLLAQEKRS